MGIRNGLVLLVTVVGCVPGEIGSGSPNTPALASQESIGELPPPTIALTPQARLAQLPPLQRTVLGLPLGVGGRFTPAAEDLGPLEALAQSLNNGSFENGVDGSWTESSSAGYSVNNNLGSSAHSGA